MRKNTAENKGIRHALEKQLWKRGVRDAMLRDILCWQVLITAGSLLSGAAVWPFHPAGAWLFWFGFGAFLSAWNFYALIKFVPKVISDGWSGKSLMVLLIHTNIRLLFTGILLYISLVWFKGPVSALLTGLGVLLVTMTAGGLKKVLIRPAGSGNGI